VTDDLTSALDAAGPRGMAAKGDPLAGLQLPDFPGPTVMLYAEQLRKFRDSYENLMAFAADACGVTLQRLCALDLEKYRADHDLEPRDLVSAYLIRQA